MSNSFNSPTGVGGSNGGPPGQNMLVVTLALLGAVLGTPFLFNYVGPFVENLVYKAYGSQEFADLMYFVSFVLSGFVIFAVCRIALWYAIAGIVAFGSMRMAGLAI